MVKYISQADYSLVLLTVGCDMETVVRSTLSIESDLPKLEQALVMKPPETVALIKSFILLT